MLFSDEMVPQQGQICVRCVMDESDPAITFDSSGLCSHCSHFDRVTRRQWHPDEVGEAIWTQAVAKLKANPTKDGYHCAIGLSGGLDSSQLVLLAYEAGLNPLIVHVDAGWNSELAVSNIEKVLDATGFDLYTVVANWSAVRDLQLAYLRSGVINQDVPQDHAFIAGLFSVAKHFGIQDVISGHNIATESVLPISWGFSPMDTVNLKAIYRRFGTGKGLKGYPLLPVTTWLRVNTPFPLLRFVQPLNWLPYNKEKSLTELQKVGWRPYPRKHGESRFTVFYQEYILPVRYRIDKRRAHYASLIEAGQMTRAEALQALREPMLTHAQVSLEGDFFCRKLEISRSELDRLMRMPKRKHSSMPNATAGVNLARRTTRIFKKSR